MATIADLPGDLVGEILAKVPLTSLKAVRSTCKKWNALSKSQIIGKAAKNQFLGFVVINSRVSSMKFNDGPIRKKIRELEKVKFSNVFHCNGLLLCVVKDQSRLLLWNPYLGKTRRIRSSENLCGSDMYALGYDSNNRNLKILRIFDDAFRYKIYDFSCNSWRDVDVEPNWDFKDESGVSLKGNTYFFGEDMLTKDGEEEEFIICFDFTAERFGPPLRLPFHSEYQKTMSLSCVRDEQLALLCLGSYDTFETLEILVSTKIEPNAVSWSTFLKVDMTPLNGFPDHFSDHFNHWSFFIDEEKKIVVVSDVNLGERTKTWLLTVYIIGENGCLKSVNTGEASSRKYPDLVFSSYVPSLVQLHVKKQRKKKDKTRRNY